jgi:hypothetical protein
VLHFFTTEPEPWPREVGATGLHSTEVWPPGPEHMYGLNVVWRVCTIGSRQPIEYWSDRDFSLALPAASARLDSRDHVHTHLWHDTADRGCLRGAGRGREGAVQGRLRLSGPEDRRIFRRDGLKHSVRVDRARRLHSIFDSINQVAKHAPRAPVQRSVRWHSFGGQLGVKRHVSTAIAPVQRLSSRTS